MTSELVIYCSILICFAVYMAILLLGKEKQPRLELEKDWNFETLLSNVKQQLNRKAYSENGNDIKAAKLYEALHVCSLGSEPERLLIKECIKELLEREYEFGEMEYDRIIPFSKPSLMTAQDCLEALLYVYEKEYGREAFDKLCRIYGFDMEKHDQDSLYYEITEEEIRFAWQSEGVCLNCLDKSEIVAQRIYQELYGFSVCDRFISSEIAVDSISAGCGGNMNPLSVETKQLETNAIYIMLHGKKIRMSCICFESETVLESVVKKLARNHPKAQLSRKSCYLITGLRNDTRVVVMRPPASERWCFYVRKFNSICSCRPEELLTDLNYEMAVDLLRLLVCGCQNLIITGEQASGKTTLLKCMVGFIDKRLSIRVAENAFETRLSEVYPDRNIQTMQEYDNIGMEEILSLFKKTDTDVTICGEINEMSAAQVYIQLSQSGGRFTMCTSHHKTTDKLIGYMRNALLKSAGFQSETAARDQVVEAIHFDIHMGADDIGHRYIERITEIIPDENSGYVLRDIMRLINGRYECINPISGIHSAEIRNRLPDGTVDRNNLLWQGGESNIS